ncbi:MAG: response regulator [Eubacteriales bacterium]|nr:response regulator [Eubacteriales bacterium]
MKRVLIVEDERLIRRGLLYLIPWQDYACQVIGDAADGLEAFEMIEALAPDILLCDIRMPRMDGLDLIRKIRQSWPESDLACILLSSYDDFDYAREALRLGVDEYLLKPLDETELASTLARVIARQEDQRRLRRQAALADCDQRLLGAMPAGQRSRRSEMAEVLEYCHSHIGERLTLEEISRQFYRSSGRFNSDFKLYTGYTFNDYLNRYRIHLALRLLIDDELSIQAIASRLGFEDSKYFARVFKKYLDCSPQVFREQQSAELRIFLSASD